MDQDDSRYAVVPGEDWHPAPPEHVPGPSVWPPAVALGSTLLVWGLITTWILSAVGGLVFAIAVFRWIQEIRHERNSL